ncbi:hypothetical protein ACP4OV_017297 [Aristida adscensionis]
MPKSPAAGGTPWKGRLRSHHATPQSAPPRRPPRAKSREEAEEAQPSRRRAAVSQSARRGGGRGDGAEAVRRPTAPPRRSPRLTGRDPGHSIAVDGGDEECKVRNTQSAITPLRRSARLHKEVKSSGKQLLSPNAQQMVQNRTQDASRKDKKQEIQRNQRNAVVKPSPRMKCHKKPQPPCQNFQDIPSSQKIADVSRRKRKMQEPKPSRCEVLTTKRKIGTESGSLSKRQCYQELELSTPGRKEIAPRNETRKPVGRMSSRDCSFTAQPKIDEKILMNVGENNGELSGIRSEVLDHSYGSDDWTEEQDMALRQAYFTAQPSPHFWKRISKMVPGRSAEECFNRIHADLSTPTPMGPRPRTCKAKFSPLANFSLSDSKLSSILEPTVGRKRTSKQKSLAAHKTVRHLLQKHCLMDQAQAADHFSVFENSPTALQLDISLEDSPGTLAMESGSSFKCGRSSSARKKPISRLTTKQAEPSPAVLKPVKNPILHEKYINRLTRREDGKRPRKRTPASDAAASRKPLSELQAGDMKAAKNALISEASSYISDFKKLQANPLAHVLETSEDDQIVSTESDSDNGHEDDD